MVNKKVVIIATFLVVVVIAAAVVLSVIFTLPSSYEDGEPADVPDGTSFNPGVKRAQVSGNLVNNTWLMTFNEDAPISSIKTEMENAGMPWEITQSNDHQKTMTMICEESILPQALTMKGIAKYGKYVEQEQIWTTGQTATWGLDRIDQRNLPLSGTYSSGSINGASVDVHILDTGIFAAHTEFGSRVQAGFDAVNDGNAVTTDCQGHGTHVAGTVGGTTWGVAKGVTLIASRVLGCDGSGSTTGIVNAINYVANLQTSRRRVINMSLGGGQSTALDSAVANAVNKGVVVVVAAGNENQDACNVSPARAPSAITVVASDKTDVRASFSNYGTCTDIIAPGVNIVSANYQSASGSRVLSGTSMASPHVAGAAALVLAKFPTYTPAQVANYLTSTATPNKVTSLPTGTPNKLLFWDNTGNAATTQSTTSSQTTQTTPATSAPPTTGATTVTGTLQQGQGAWEPGNTYYTVTSQGTHIGRLTGDAGTDFDLYLYRYVNGQWVQVSKSEGPTSAEAITYTDTTTAGGASYFIYRVQSYSGTGSYSLTFTKP